MSTAAAARQNAPQTSFDLPTMAREFAANLPVVIFFKAMRQALQSSRAAASRSQVAISR